MLTKKTGAWVRLPLDLLSAEGVSKNAASICAVIVDAATSTPKLSADLTREEIASKAGCSLATVRRALTELERLGLISHTRTGRGSVYKLTGLVELCPAACEPKKRPAAPAAPKPTPRAKAQAKMEAYLSTVNRFKQIAEDDEPLAGQMEFSTEEVSV